MKMLQVEDRVCTILNLKKQDSEGENFKKMPKGVVAIRLSILCDLSKRATINKKREEVVKYYLGDEKVVVNTEENMIFMYDKLTPKDVGYQELTESEKEVLKQTFLKYGLNETGTNWYGK